MIIRNTKRYRSQGKYITQPIHLYYFWRQ